MMSLRSVLFCTAALLGLAACCDESSLSEEMLERNFSLPCETLELKCTRWDADLNVLVVELAAHPGNAFYEGLRVRGWEPEGSQAFSRYLKDNMFLEYHGAEKTLIIRSTLYLRGGAEKEVAP